MVTPRGPNQCDRREKTDGGGLHHDHMDRSIWWPLYFPLYTLESTNSQWGMDFMRVEARWLRTFKFFAGIIEKWRTRNCTWKTSVCRVILDYWPYMLLNRQRFTDLTFHPIVPLGTQFQSWGMQLKLIYNETEWCLNFKRCKSKLWKCVIDILIVNLCTGAKEIKPNNNNSENHWFRFQPLLHPQNNSNNNHSQLEIHLW